MASPIRNDWTLRKIVQNTYAHMRNRFEYKQRDVVKRIIVRKVNQYNISKNQKRTTFEIISSSFPNYWPYFTKTDSRGRPRQYQRTYRHQYDVIISLDRLSIDVPFKARVGTDRKWDFSKKARASKDKRGRVIESKNVLRGINGDFFFRCSWLWRQEGILFGRNYADGKPNIVNPKSIIFAPKHLLGVVEQLMLQGILK